jgi:hypothetical protein
MNKIAVALVFVAFVACFSQAYNLTAATVYAQSPFGISNLAQTPDNIYPGDEVRLQFDLSNTGTGTTNYHNAALYTLVPFGVTKSEYNIGAFNVGDSKQVLLNFDVPSNTEPGTYEIEMYAVTDGAEAQVGEIPLVVNSPDFSNALIESIVTQGNLVAGHDTTVTVNVRNTAPLNATNVVVQMEFNASGVLLPLGSDRVFIPSIPAGGTAQAVFDLGTDANAAPGYYPITFGMSFQINQQPQPATAQTSGLTVSSTPSLEVTAQSTDITQAGSTGNVLIQVNNLGVSDVSSLQVKLLPSKDYVILSAPIQYVGSVNSNDFETAQFNIHVSDNATSPLAILSEVDYSDASNTAYSKNASSPIALFSRTEAIQYGLETIPDNTLTYVVLALVVLYLLYRYALPPASRFLSRTFGKKGPKEKA